MMQTLLRFNLLFLFTIAIIFPLQAQLITLEESVERSMAQYPAIAAKVAALKASEANLKMVKDNRLPNLRLHDQVQLGTANSLPGSVFSMGLIVPTSGSIRPSNTMEMASGNIALAFMDWEIFNFGRFHAEQQAARADIDVGESEVEIERFMLRQAVINTYLDVLRLRQFARIEEKNIVRAGTAYRIISNLVRSGIKPGLDTSLAVAELSRARLGFLQIQEQYREALINLAMLTGSQVSAIDIDTTFNKEHLLQSFANLASSSAQHPLLRYRERIINRQTSEIEMIRKSAMPRLSFLSAAWMRGSSLDYEGRYGPLASGLVYSRYNFLLGAGITFNVFDVRRAKRRIDVQTYRIEEADHQLAAEKLRINNMLTTADSLMLVLREELQEIPIAIRAANDVYNQRLNLYNNGLENIIGLQDALQLIYNSEKEYETARDKATRLMLQRALATNNFEPFFALFRN